MSTPSEAKDGLDRIRDILVGAVQRDLERKLSRIETAALARVGELQQESRRRLDVIESHLRKETEALDARLTGELVEIKDALRALTRDHRETNSAMDQRVAKLEESLSRAQHDLRNQILEQAKSFLDELHRTREELTETLERELAGLELEGEEEPDARDRREDGEHPVA